MKKTVLILLALLNILLAVAQIRGNSIVVTVEPDHQDWNYRVGETARFTVEVRRSGTLVHDVSITYAAGPEMYQDVRKTVTLKDGTLRLTGKMGEPGFYRVDVTARCLCSGLLARVVAALNGDASRLQVVLGKVHRGGASNTFGTDAAATARTLYKGRERL